MSKNFLVVDASYPINTRTQRFVDSLIEAFGEDNVHVVGWNRDNSQIKHPEYFIFSKEAPYGNRFDKIKGIWRFRKYLKKIVDQLKPDYVVASHWDCLYIAAGVIGHETKLIYENLDIPTGNKAVRVLEKFLESRALRKTSIMTLASRFYQGEYSSYKGRIFVVENKMPQNSQLSFSLKDTGFDHLNISYIGGIRYAEILKNVIEAVQDLDNVTFHIYGGGHQFKEVEEYSKCKKNVVLHGPYNYSEIGRIYEQTNIVWAVYPSSDHNVMYAISNKYHECLHYGIPGLFAQGTCLSDLVDTNRAGFPINCYSVSDIRSTIKRLADNPDLIREASANLGKMREVETDNWEDEVRPFIDFLREIK